MWAVVVFALISVCVAQTPSPCMTPQQWTARRVKWDRKRNFTEYAKHTYDATMQRTRTVEEMIIGKETDYYDVLRLHQIRTEYRLNLKTRQCNSTVLDRPFFPVAIPPNAHYDFEAELGPAQIPGEHMTIREWDGNFTDGSHYYLSVTYPSCDPVALDVFNKDEHFGERYFDLENAIRDPDVFIPPKECLRP